MAILSWGTGLASFGNTVLSGTAYNDSLVAYGGENSVIRGLEGDDIIKWYAWAGWDAPAHATISGGPGKDYIYPCSGGLGVLTRNTVFCGDGNDYVEANGGLNTIYGGTGDDLINSGNDDDVVVGEAGNDRLYGMKGNDCITGDASDLPVSVHGADYIHGGDGNDQIWGNAGDDTLVGGVGNDTIGGNEDNDLMYGGEGDDNFVGGHGGDTVWGGSGNDNIYGDASDIDVSLHGADWLYGDVGDDHIFGYAGNDSLGGGAGEDWLEGGAGNDSLWGCDGHADGKRDVFVLRACDGNQADEIMDFESGVDAIYVPDACFIKAELHGNDLWAYVSNDSGIIIHNAVGKTLRYQDASANYIQSYKV